MSTLVVLTAGQSDVQVVVDGVRHELRKDRCAALHDEIERRTGGWRLVDSPERKADRALEALPDGELLLCTPKLDAILRDRDLTPTSVLVLDTRRDREPRDPRHAGAVLEVRLRGAGLRTVQRCTYLVGDERLEDPDVPRDAVLRREVVRRLDEAVQAALRSSSPTRVVVASTGGFPVVGTLVEEIVRLRADVPVDPLEVADGARMSPPTADRAVPRSAVPEPVVSFQARRRALELVEGGNLLGAWAVVQHLHADPVEQRWTRVIEWLACFAASLPMPQGCELPVLTHARMAVRAALRVELALRAGDIPRAVHGTVAFGECALWDHLGEHVTRHSDPKKSRWFRLTPEPEAKLVATEDADREKPFLEKARVDGVVWYWIRDGDGNDGRIAKRYLRKAHLQTLCGTLSDLRELRNDVAHNEPTPSLMEDARRRMAEKHVWSAGAGFLSQPLVQGVLRELGEARPEALCDDLLEAVRACVRALG